jgi:hypothetical protein
MTRFLRMQYHKAVRQRAQQQQASPVSVERLAQPSKIILGLNGRPLPTYPSSKAQPLEAKQETDTGDDRSI